MGYDDYSYADYSVDDESYGYDSYDDADDAYDLYDPDDDDSIVIKPYDWDIYDSDDDVEYHESYDDVEFTHQVVTKSPGKSNTNNTGGSSIPPSRSSKPLSELDFNGTKTHLRQSKLAFQYVMNELLKQELDGPVSLSLLQYTGNVMDIELILGMTDEEINNLHYFKTEVDTSSPPSKLDDVKPKTVTVRRNLPTGYKRLLKVFTSFHKHLREESIEIYFYWSNIDLKQFTYYRQYNYNGNVTVPAPSRLVKPDVKSENRFNTQQLNIHLNSDIPELIGTIYLDNTSNKYMIRGTHESVLVFPSHLDMENGEKQDPHNDN